MPSAKPLSRKEAANRADICLADLCKFRRKGQTSLGLFLKLLKAFGYLKVLLKTKFNDKRFESIGSMPRGRLQKTP